MIAARWILNATGSIEVSRALVIMLELRENLKDPTFTPFTNIELAREIIDDQILGLTDRNRSDRGITVLVTTEDDALKRLVDFALNVNGAMLKTVSAGQFERFNDICRIVLVEYLNQYFPELIVPQSN